MKARDFFIISNAAIGVSMSERQRKANNGRVGKVELFGITLCIEQPRGSTKNGGVLSAHYGYIKGHKGADGAAIDCFIGPNPHESTVYVIDHFKGGKFDEHKVMFCFDHPSYAQEAYTSVYGKRPKNMTRVTLANFRKWLMHGDITKPYKQETMKKQFWKDDTPDGASLDSVIYDIRRTDDEGLMLDPVSVQEILDDADSSVALDAMVVPYNRLQRSMEVMNRQLGRVQTTVKPISVQISDPFKKNGVAQVAVVWELSDGQTISVFFHNPDTTPAKIQPTDNLVSWKWMLNKKDITIVVAPERGQDLNVRMVTQRVMKLADKNSAAFTRRNKNRAEKLERIASLKTEVAAFQKELDDKLHTIEVMKQELEDLQAMPTTEAQPKAEDMPQPVRDADPEPKAQSVASIEEQSKAEEGMAHQAATDVQPESAAEEETVAPEPVATPKVEPETEGIPLQDVQEPDPEPEEAQPQDVQEPEDVQPEPEEPQPKEQPETEEPAHDPLDFSNRDTVLQWLRETADSTITNDDKALIDQLIEVSEVYPETDAEIHALIDVIITKVNKMLSETTQNPEATAE